MVSREQHTDYIELVAMRRACMEDARREADKVGYPDAMPFYQEEVDHINEVFHYAIHEWKMDVLGY